MNDNNNNSNTNNRFPYLSVASILVLFGIILGYLMVDLYTQRKADLSILQIVKLVSVDRKEERKHDINDTIKTYKLFINGVEHNFSFSGFTLEELHIDGMTLEYIKSKRKRK